VNLISACFSFALSTSHLGQCVVYRMTLILNPPLYQIII
jgi:hypothetical protein